MFPLGRTEMENREETASRPRYQMTISRLTVDKLGVKLYDRVSAVIAELIANSYDADATEVQVVAPMDELLATKAGGELKDKGYAIEVNDNGTGMTPEEVNEFYLVVGKERRIDPKRGDRSKTFGRKVMGRKGVGKLAPFGICQRIEILTSGGEEIERDGQRGFVTAHLTLERSGILTDTDSAYHPVPGELDGSLRSKRGTQLKLSVFDHRRVPNIESFERQLAQRFGLPSQNWEIRLVDSLKTENDEKHSRVVGQFSVQKMDQTEIRFEKRDDESYCAIDADGNEISDFTAGFNYEDRFYPITGWAAFSKSPYKDDLMAGVRVYCRGKIAARTAIFNMKAGFTGEYDIRSYLIGELHANWLDEEEDLIRTDRQDILWSHALGQEFEKWGQSLVKRLGKVTRGPRRKRAWEIFEEISKIAERVLEAFPSDDQESIRQNTLEVAKVIGKTTREDELRDEEHVEALVDLSLLIGPHITLDQKLREAAERHEGPLPVITAILRTARIAELAGFGKIAEDRVKVIRRIERLKDDTTTLEAVFQSLISEAPWLINPQWSPITANQSFATLRQEFEKYYKQRTGTDLVLHDVSEPQKRADFVLSNQDNALQLIEIKRPGHALDKEEMERIQTYIDLMLEFLSLEGNQEFARLFPNFHVTLVCDAINLSGVHKTALDKFKNEGRLTHITWNTFLLRTRKTHEDFLVEAEKQRHEPTGSELHSNSD